MLKLVARFSSDLLTGKCLPSPEELTSLTERYCRTQHPNLLTANLTRHSIMQESVSNGDLWSVRMMAQNAIKSVCVLIELTRRHFPLCWTHSLRTLLSLLMEHLNQGSWTFNWQDCLKDISLLLRGRTDILHIIEESVKANIMYVFVYILSVAMGMVSVIQASQQEGTQLSDMLGLSSYSSFSVFLQQAAGEPFTLAHWEVIKDVLNTLSGPEAEPTAALVLCLWRPRLAQSLWAHNAILLQGQLICCTLCKAQKLRSHLFRSLHADLETLAQSEPLDGMELWNMLEPSGEPLLSLSSRDSSSSDDDGLVHAADGSASKRRRLKPVAKSSEGKLPTKRKRDGKKDDSDAVKKKRGRPPVAASSSMPKRSSGSNGSSMPPRQQKASHDSNIRSPLLIGASSDPLMRKTVRVVALEPGHQQRSLEKKKKRGRLLGIGKVVSPPIGDAANTNSREEGTGDKLQSLLIIRFFRAFSKISAAYFANDNSARSKLEKALHHLASRSVRHNATEAHDEEVKSAALLYDVDFPWLKHWMLVMIKSMQDDREALESKSMDTSALARSIQSGLLPNYLLTDKMLEALTPKVPSQPSRASSGMMSGEGEIRGLLDQPDGVSQDCGKPEKFTEDAAVCDAGDQTDALLEIRVGNEDDYFETGDWIE